MLFIQYFVLCSGLKRCLVIYVYAFSMEVILLVYML